MILVVLSTHAELASATAGGRSYWETGELEREGCVLDLGLNVHQWLKVQESQILKLPWSCVFNFYADLIFIFENNYVMSVV